MNKNYGEIWDNLKNTISTICSERIIKMLMDNNLELEIIHISWKYFSENDKQRLIKLMEKYGF